MSFYVSEKQITSSADTDRSMSCWLPVPEAELHLYDTDKNEADPEHIEIEIEGEQRRLFGPFLGMATIYNVQRDRRTLLGHDCGVFALSCETNDPLSGKVFGKMGDEVRIATFHNTEPFSPDYDSDSRGSGELLLIAGEDGANSHILVRATTDEGQPLYLSKIGTDGPVVLSDLERIAMLYDATQVSAIAGLYSTAPTL